VKTFTSDEKSNKKQLAAARVFHLSSCPAIREVYVPNSIRILIAVCLCLAGCQSESEDTQAVPQPAPAAAATAELVQVAAGELVNRFQKTLKTELMNAIAARQASGAIEVCRDVAPIVSDSFSAEGWTIRRVSDKNRNPENRATLEELAILAGFVENADGPSAFVLIDTLAEDSTRIFRYYAPIYTQQLCLSCHGGMQTLSPGVYQAVKKTYPDDKAVGYTIGQVRGMFVVEAKWPEGEPLARVLASGK
jgi:hypothetical protein